MTIKRFAWIVGEFVLMVGCVIGAFLLGLVFVPYYAWKDRHEGEHYPLGNSYKAGGHYSHPEVPR